MKRERYDFPALKIKHTRNLRNQLLIKFPKKLIYIVLF